MEGRKTNFSRRLKQFDGLTWLTMHNPIRHMHVGSYVTPLQNPTVRYFNGALNILGDDKFAFSTEIAADLGNSTINEIGPCRSLMKS